MIMSGMVLENCGFLIEVLLELQRSIGECLLAVVLYGSSVRHGCRRGHDIDLFVMFSDSCGEVGNVAERLASKVHRKYGYILSINVAPLSRVLQDLALGDKFIRNVVLEGVPLYGEKLVASLKQYAETGAPVSDRESIFGV